MRTLHDRNATPMEKARMLLPLIALLYLLMALYPLVGNLSVQLRTPYDLQTALDAWIPFAPAIVGFYLLMLLYPLAGLVMTLRKSITAQELRALYLTHILLLLACYAIYLAFPTTAAGVMVQATPSELAHNPFVAIVDAMYRMSVPTNAFPSYHVAPLVLISLFLFRRWPALFWASLPLALLAAAGTVLTKFHVILDVAGGVAMGALAYAVAFRRIARWLATRSAKRMPAILRTFTL